MPKSINLADYRADRMDPENPEYEPVRLSVEEAMNRDVRRAAANVGAEGARFFVQAYYRAQKERIQTANQIRALTEADEPVLTISYFHERAASLENNYKSVLGVWALQTEAGVWAQSVYGCGPVLSAVCSAYFDIARCPTVGHMWSYAGLLPPEQQPWEKGEKRPWNADLKVAMWKLGRCFVRSSNNEKSFYGLIYRQRKQYEIERNERGGNRDCAERTLSSRNITDPGTLACYTGAENCSHDRSVPKRLPRPEVGIPHLPPGRIDLRASRYAVKLFLAHGSMWRSGSITGRTLSTRRTGRIASAGAPGTRRCRTRLQCSPAARLTRSARPPGSGSSRPSKRQRRQSSPPAPRRRTRAKRQWLPRTSTSGPGTSGRTAPRPA